MGAPPSTLSTVTLLLPRESLALALRRVQRLRDGAIQHQQQREGRYEVSRQVPARGHGERAAPTRRVRSTHIQL